MTSKQLIIATIEWFKTRGLDKANPVMQLPKLLEELGETVRAHRLNDVVDLVDGFGDQVVVLIGIMVQLGYSEDEIVNIFTEAENLLTYNHPDPFHAIVENYGYLASDILRNTTSVDSFEMIIAVLITAIVNYSKLNIYQCLAQAYDEIKDRLGMVVDGIYIKAKDLSIPQLIDLSARLTDDAQVTALWTLMESKVEGDMCANGTCKIEVK